MWTMMTLAILYILLADVWAAAEVSSWVAVDKPAKR